MGDLTLFITTFQTMRPNILKNRHVESKLVAILKHFKRKPILYDTFLLYTYISVMFLVIFRQT